MEKDFYKQLLLQEEQLKKTLDALLTLKKSYTSEQSIKAPKAVIKANKPLRPFIAPKAYDKNLSFTKKIYVALLKINQGTASDIAKSLNKIDPSISLKKAESLATLHCSQLYSKLKAIEAKKDEDGRKYIYSIKK